MFDTHAHKNILRNFFGVGRGSNPKPCIFYALSIPTEHSKKLIIPGTFSTKSSHFLFPTQMMGMIYSQQLTLIFLFTLKKLQENPPRLESYATFCFLCICNQS